MNNITPLKAIRKRCLECNTFSTKEIRNCQHSDCDLYNYRMGKGRGRYLKFIRKYCLWCCIGSRKEVALCTCGDCPLYNFRFGKNPNRVKGTG